MDEEQAELVDSENAPPRLFVSYSWTSSRHEDWVLQLASDLKSNGVDVVLDKWHLKVGQDAHEFMEQMVRSGELDKIILVCDRKYVERANRREGGVGVESQVITQQLYEDVKQTKIAGIVTEAVETDQPMVPNFLLNRLWIDFRDPSSYGVSLQNLLRWIFDKPLYREPEIGPRPKFLDDQVDFEPLSFGNQPGVGHNSRAEIDLVEFLLKSREQRGDFTVEMSADEPNDESVYRTIRSLPAFIEQFLSSFDKVLSQAELSEAEYGSTIEYFEELYTNFEKGGTSWSGDATKFLARFLFTALIARCVKHRRFTSGKRLLDSQLVKRRPGELTAEAKPLRSLNCFLPSLDARKSRLKLNRASLEADLIKEFCETLSIDFADFIQADLVLAISQSDWEAQRIWWPDSAIYVADSYGALPWFIRAEQIDFRDKFMPMLKISGPDDIDKMIEDIKSGRIREIRWTSAFSTLDLPILMNLSSIKSTY
ncbi:toll/interleukin-1 receptor domain-containing protein [Erythrobacter sp. THAF29]|uniref:toll/interleukin-1 receptor domain-containing protein n=1 Tax=Erythrobacter sp. THAF29 TaxID=2587851 RepID=UPI0012687049|nr:TIR domain-containing protein [Erythrobacter sp. THAF29]QFT78225.1 SEFIR domain protein [Erythrobacter sp. THAF29]